LEGFFRRVFSVLTRLLGISLIGSEAILSITAMTAAAGSSDSGSVSRRATLITGMFSFPVEFRKPKLHFSCTGLRAGARRA
jgi:hypothetical protein